MAVDRVRIRVSEGGHNIQNDVIKRRYFGGIKNLFDIYLNIVDQAVIFDSSGLIPETIAYKTFDLPVAILQLEKFNNIKLLYDGE